MLLVQVKPSFNLMKPQNELALIIGYYLSRMDREGYSLLGYKTFSEATIKIGEILSVKKNTIKNMRDEFDPYHQNNRIGWKRELRGSRFKILQTFQETDDETLLEIVKEILSNKEFRSTEEYQDIHNLFSERKEYAKRKRDPVFVVRGPTGKAAEKYFVEYFRENSLPVAGKLTDKREFGCGYDFDIETNGETFFIEVKGLTSEDGGISFTDKEWRTALKYGNKYYLFIVKNISLNPFHKIIQNPAAKLNPRRNIYTAIHVNWGVSAKYLK